MAARDGLSQPFEGYPAYGSVHEVVPSRQLLTFLSLFNEAAFDIFDDSQTEISIKDVDFENGTEEQYVIKSSDFDPRGHFKVFNPDTLSVTVLEMDPSATAARKVQSLWERQDFGAVENDAKNELGRKLPNQKLHVVFDQAIPVGGRLPNVPNCEVRQKIALVPSVKHSPEIYDLVNREADICIRAIRSRLKQFVYPWDITPHMTFAVFKRQATPTKISELIDWTNDYLKDSVVGTGLDPLSFRHKSVRGKKHS